MPGIKLAPFGGMLPAVDDRLLPDVAAAFSRNSWLYPGTLSGINKQKHIRDLSSDLITKVYRIPNSYSESAYFEDSIWMEFTDIDTDVIRNLVVGDTFDRYYWAAPSHPPRYNTLARIAAGNTGANAPWLLGIPPPTVTPTLSIVGGGATTDVARAYVYTFVSAYGEEGPPSAPVNGTGKPDATWKITMGPADPNDLGGVGANRYLDKRRIYRTITSLSGVATFFLVAELPIATLTYDDALPDSEVANNSLLESTNWNAPPSDLQGIVTMANGMVAGFRGNEVWFCEPYRMHAWPALYTIAVEYPIVGLGVINQGLVILTQGYPHLAVGVNPASISVSKFAGLLPCTSRGSICSSPEGVFFTSPKGLELISQGVAACVTEKMVLKDTWQELVKINTLRAARLGNAYYAFGSARFGVFSDAFATHAFAQEDFSGGYAGVLIDVSAPNVAFSTMSLEDPVTNIMIDPWSNEVFVIRDGKLYWLDIAAKGVEVEPYIWKSKVFQTTSVKNLAVIRVYFTIPAAAPTPDPVRNTDINQQLGPNQYGIVRAYADGRLVMARELRESGELMRLPSGFKADFWQFEFEGRVEITNVQVGSSVKALASV